MNGFHICHNWFVFVPDPSARTWSKLVPNRTIEDILPSWSSRASGGGTRSETHRHHHSIPGVRSRLHREKVTLMIQHISCSDINLLLYSFFTMQSILKDGVQIFTFENQGCWLSQLNRTLYFLSQPVENVYVQLHCTAKYFIKYFMY